MRINEWQKHGKKVRILDKDIFYLKFGRAKETLCILHGFPTSSHDFYKIIEPLSSRFTVILHDHPGFGFSQKPVNYSYSLIEQAEAALALYKKLGIKKAHFLAHDYGTSVMTEILARREISGIDIDVQSLTLCNGSLHIELANLRLVQVLLRLRVLGPLVARLSNLKFFKLQMKSLWVNKSLLSEEELDDMWFALNYNEGARVLPLISRYLYERSKFWHRWIGALTRLDIPVHILWAQLDPVSVPAIGNQLAEEIPRSVYTRLENLGHYPMLESPERFIFAADDFYNHLKPLPGRRRK